MKGLHLKRHDVMSRTAHMPMEPSWLPECCRQLAVCTCFMVNMRCVVLQEVILKGVPWDRVTWGMPLLGVLQRLHKLVLTDNHLSNLHQVSRGCCQVLYLCVQNCRDFFDQSVSKQSQQQEEPDAASQVQTDNRMSAVIAAVLCSVSTTTIPLYICPYCRCCTSPYNARHDSARCITA